MPVPVEKRFPAKIVISKLHQDALKAILSNFKAFCIPQISSVFDEDGVFQQSRLSSPINVFAGKMLGYENPILCPSCANDSYFTIRTGCTGH
jgi:hypothetical protein